MIMPAPVDLAQCLAVEGAKDRFGRTAAEVLDFAQQVALAQSSWDKSTIAVFQDAQAIHPKVWGKLVAIARSTNLASLPQERLPAAYTALYALEVMSPEELRAAVSEKVVRADASSRSILDWTKAYRLRGTGIKQEMPLTLVLRDELTQEQQQDLLSAMKQVAGRFGAELLQGKGGVKQADLKAEGRKALAAQIEEDLMQEIGQVVASAPADLKSRFGIRTAADLLEAPRGTFTGFFQNLEGKVEGAFWRQHGRAYCLRIARDYNLTESRAERYQFRKRIKDAAEKWRTEIKGFQTMAEEIQRTYLT